MAVKLVATDLDGTLLNNGKKFDYQRFTALLDQMDARDMKLVVATGNHLDQIKQYFAPVNPARLLYISSNGAMVSDNEDILYERPVSKAQIKKVVAWNASTRAEMENLIILSGAKAAYVSNHATPEIIQAVRQFYPRVEQIDKLVEVDDDILVMELIWPENANVKEYVKELRQTFGEELHTTGSGFGSVSILAAHTDKSTGLKALSDIYGIQPDEMAAFGDNSNDLEMLRYVGHPYVMPNAEAFMHERIPSTAVADNEHDGVIATIEQLIEQEDQNR